MPAINEARSLAVSTRAAIILSSNFDLRCPGLFGLFSAILIVLSFSISGDLFCLQGHVSGQLPLQGSVLLIVSCNSTTSISFASGKPGTSTSGFAQQIV